MGEKFAVLDAQDAIPIETLIDTMRKKIDYDCLILLQQARRINTTKGNFRIKTWESRINQIRETKQSTFDLAELKHLKEQCHFLSEQLSNFRE